MHTSLFGFSFCVWCLSNTNYDTSEPCCLFVHQQSIKEENKPSWTTPTPSTAPLQAAPNQTACPTPHSWTAVHMETNWKVKKKRPWSLNLNQGIQGVVMDWWYQCFSTPSCPKWHQAGITQCCPADSSTCIKVLAMYTKKNTLINKSYWQLQH